MTKFCASVLIHLWEHEVVVKGEQATLRQQLHLWEHEVVVEELLAHL